MLKQVTVQLQQVNLGMNDNVGSDTSEEISYTDM